MLAVALLVLNHVSVIDVAQGVAIPDRAIEIESTRVRAVLAAKSYRPPPGSMVHDLPGRFVVPGFIDMHAHVLALLRTLPLHGVTTVRDPGDATEAAVAVRQMLAPVRSWGRGLSPPAEF
ncbi:MAG: amidohydrolase [Candidatus Solibacter sp.]|jgi:adenine deaminase|nr:amidohydrolase [Candidatus Solibacter sp.]